MLLTNCNNLFLFDYPMTELNIFNCDSENVPFTLGFIPNVLLL